MRAALKLCFLKLGNPVTDQSIVIIVLISSYKVFCLHVNAWVKYTCTRAQHESLFTLTLLRCGGMN